MPAKGKQHKKVIAQRKRLKERDMKNIIQKEKALLVLDAFVKQLLNSIKKHS